MNKYLESTQYINWDNPSVITKAKALSVGCANSVAVAQRCFEFVRDEINPHVKQWEEAEQFPSHEVFKKMGDLGLLGVKYAEEDGGLGLDFSYSMVVAEELGRINCGGVPMAIGVQTDMCTPATCRI